MPEITVVSREEWGAVEPKYQEPLTPPVEMVIFHCDGRKECVDKTSCTKAVRRIQRCHISLGLPDILYNFLIGGDGVIYEGRGWETLSTKYPDTRLNGKVVDVAYIGPYKFPDKIPSQKMMHTAKNLINWGRSKNILHEDCRRSDLDLQVGEDSSDAGSDDNDSDIDPDDLLSEKDTGYQHVDNVTYKDVFGTPAGSTSSDDDSDMIDENDGNDSSDDTINESEVFNPEEDDMPYEI